MGEEPSSGEGPFSTISTILRRCMVEESRIEVEACLRDGKLMAFVTALVSRGLLQEGEDGRFRTTDEGRRYVEGFRELSGDLDELASIEDSSSLTRPKILRRYR